MRITHEGQQKQINGELVIVAAGVTGNAAQNILLNKGFKKVYNLSGGNRTYQACRRCQK